MKKRIKITAVYLVIMLMTAFITSCLSDVSDAGTPSDVSDTVTAESSESDAPGKDNVSAGEVSADASDEVSAEASTPEESMPEEHIHQYGEWTTEKEATEEAEGSKRRVCSCGYEETEVIPKLAHVHAYGEWKLNNSTHWKECRCGQKAEISSHVFGRWEIVAAKTCTATGMRQRVCTACGYNKSSELPATSHKYVSVLTPATNTEKGYVTNTCEKCGDKYIDCYSAPGTVYSERLEYYVNSDGVTARIAGIGTCEDSVLNIPPVIDGYRVTNIMSHAFSDCTGISEVILPESITDIGVYCFFRSNSIKYEVYDNALYLGTADNPYYALMKVIDKKASDCEIHPETRVIAGMAFAECREIKRIVIPDNVKVIGTSAFEGCSGLAEVTFGRGLIKIGNFAFSDCISITEVVIPDNVIIIDSLAFAYCDSLVNVYIGNGVKEIGENAFWQCGELTNVTLGNNVTNIKIGAFDQTPKLNLNKYGNAYYLGTADNPHYALIRADDTVKKVTIHANAKIIAGEAFKKCKITSIEMGRQVTHIGEMAFMFCYDLKSVTVSASVLHIGNAAFSRCIALTDVTIAEGVLTIGSSAFDFCGIVDITIPDSVVTIGAGAFSECYKLMNVTIGNGATEIGNLMFYKCRKLESVSIGKNIKHINPSAFSECENLKDIYYKGSEADWQKLISEHEDTELTNTKIHYNS